MSYLAKIWDWVVASKDTYLEIIDWFGTGGVAVLWPASVVAVWWFL